MKTILVLTAAILLSASAYAKDGKNNNKNVKNTVSIEAVQKVNLADITGSVIDNKSHESLVGAAIFIDGNKYYSDLDGNFAIPDVKMGKHTVKVELISYQPTEMVIDVQKDQKISIGLLQE